MLYPLSRPHPLSRPPTLVRKTMFPELKVHFYPKSTQKEGVCVISDENNCQWDVKFVYNVVIAVSERTYFTHGLFWNISRKKFPFEHLVNAYTNISEPPEGF